MSGPRESLLPEALARLTLFDVAKACGIEIKVGVQRSPFREDKKESFSVQRNRTGWKDFATGDGGSIWGFAELCMPNADKGEIARFLIGLAGLDQETPAGTARPPMVKRPEPRKDRAFVHAKRWSELVYHRWVEGVAGVTLYPVARLAKSRGWAETWIWALRRLQKLAYPYLPWCEPVEDHARRAWAFRVERLGDFVGDGSLLPDPVGYHQPFEIWDKEEQKARKSYVYVPYEPAPEKQRSTFQRFLQGTVPPYPFFLGSRKPRLLVIFEGQWDACTFFFAALSERVEELDAATVMGLPWAVVGLRGVQSVEAALEVLGPYLQRANPDVWLWPDNDKAGSALLTNVEGKGACFRDRVRALTWGHLAVSKVPRVEYAPGKFTKDFNDMHQHIAPVTAADVRKIADAAKLGHHFAPAAAGVPA